MTNLRYPPYGNRFTGFDKLIARPSLFTWADFSVSTTATTTIVPSTGVDRIAFVMAKNAVGIAAATTGSFPAILISYSSGTNRYLTQYGGQNPFNKGVSNANPEARSAGYFSVEDCFSQGIKNLFTIPVPANYNLDIRLITATTTSLILSTTTYQTREPLIFLADGIVGATLLPTTIAVGNFSTTVDLTNYPIINWANQTNFTSEANTTKFNTVNIGGSSFGWNNYVRSAATATTTIGNSETFFHNQRGVRTLEITRPIINGVQSYADTIVGIHADDYAA